MFSLRLPARRAGGPCRHGVYPERSRRVTSRNDTLFRTIRLVIAFDGTRYEGWQSQRKDTSAGQGQSKTIQEVFEKILLKILRKPTGLVSSSRTDSGVHAEGLVAHFKTRSRLSDAQLKKAINFYLPKDILVHSAKTMRVGFHARYDARSKIYRYRVWNSTTRPLFEAPYVLWHPRALDTALMKRAARCLIGRYDFGAFYDAGGDERSSLVRTLKHLRIKKIGHLIEIEIEADGFLRHMVRVIVGTLIEVGRRKIPPGRVREILDSKNRKNAGPTAKPQGLMLVKVNY